MNGKIKTVVCGCGRRGAWLATTIGLIDKYEIIGLCDTYEDKAVDTLNKLKEKYGIEPKVYTDYIKMYDELKPDVAIVASSWDYHVQISIDAMKRGIKVGMEVGGGYNIEECYHLVEAYEETKTPFFFLENCCYGKDELLATSLIRNGILGEIVYCSGAYGHDLRNQILHGDVNRHYRLQEYISRNCENYPTHTLGPIAKMLNINSGNRMVSLVSCATKARGLHEQALVKDDLAHLRETEFKQGDIVITTITCENGELITLKLDTTLPRFYSRELSVRGTKGWYNEDNNMVFLDGYEHHIETYNGMAKYFNYAEKYTEYLPEEWKNVSEEAIKAGHGGMDFLTLTAFADYILNDMPMPIDVYDAAAWMAITCLSEKSIKEGGAPQQIPDFTKGAYKHRKTIDVLTLPMLSKN